MKTLKITWFFFLVLISCEKPEGKYECKECYFIEDKQEIKVFACGEELQKYESDNIKCIKISSKN